LSQKRYVYWWADGVYFNVRLDEERTCVLVLIGATEDDTKELLAVVDGYRESSVQGKAKQLIHEMYLAPTRKAALAAYLRFVINAFSRTPKGHWLGS
jgi:putative transposase